MNFKKQLDRLVPTSSEPVVKKKKIDLTQVKKAKYGYPNEGEPKKYSYASPQETPPGYSNFRDVKVEGQTQPAGWAQGTDPLPQSKPASKGMPMGNYGPSFNVGAGIAASLSALTALLPDNSNRKQLREEPLVYNPNAYGTGSQAIMEKGGDLSASKAREMLRDGKANGKKLTKKQKRYFGMVAAGKAEAGMAMEPHPTTPKKNTYYNDLVNKSLLAGTNPVTHIPGRALVNENMGEIVDAINLFNARPESKNLTGEERINAFYNWNTGNQKVEGWKKILGNINYTPAIDTRFTPSVDVQGKEAIAKGLAKFPSGGTINPYDGGTHVFSGPSHARGGIDIRYGNEQVEVEGGETAVRGPEGDLTIFGNMKVPGSNKTFKGVTKDLAKIEDKLSVIKDNGIAALRDVDFVNKNDIFKFNSGRVMVDGAEMGQQKAAEKKQTLAAIQRAMLDTAAEFNLDPEALSKGEEKKAKKGTWVKARHGYNDDDKKKKKKDSVAVRHNNPGNIKYGEFAKKLGAVPGDPATDGGVFAKFPDVDTGMKALRRLIKTEGYRDLPVEDALKRWTGGTGYSVPLGNLRGKTVKNLNAQEMEKLVNTITYGEDGRYYTDTPQPIAPEKPQVKAPANYPDLVHTILPKTNLTYQDPQKPTPEQVTPPELTPIQVQDRPDMPSNAERLRLTQILPELIAFAQNGQEPVPMQTYDPYLFQPYQVSYQDRINRNQGTFNQIAQQAGGNPEALASLAGQLYDANNQVAAEQFRTNQGIANDVTNKNVGILNAAELQNLQLADQQMVRQSQAKSNTKAQQNIILNSIRDKFAQNTLENRRLRAYENLYDYRFDNQGVARYEGGEATFNFGGEQVTAPSVEQTTREYDNRGNLKKSRVRTPSALDQQIKEETLKSKKRKNFWNSLFNQSR